MAENKVLIVRLSPEAERDLENIWLYTVAMWSIDQAENYIGDITSTFDLLSLSPLIARERIEFTPPVRVHRHQSHVIIYRVNGDFIDIVRVVHMKQNWSTLLGD
jgi:toxin ParE1/3/4